MLSSAEKIWDILGSDTHLQVRKSLQDTIGVMGIEFCKHIIEEEDDFFFC
jgi:hypothetical protein